MAALRADLPSLADLGYEGAADIIHVPIKKKAGQHKLLDPNRKQDAKVQNRMPRSTAGGWRVIVCTSRPDHRTPALDSP
ncbi:hypothetical protein Pth03_66590 [Planotetraspora thailandica]|uniref:DDE Tnp4 domain-containing protein n=1 Tax=Planotetraspora thailandica TaxID=487172 RepID=A0A8J3XZZ8_9ACTN|nr:hypothetical protein Pth03_66590 [Planotetraspora thailandica]